MIHLFNIPVAHAQQLSNQAQEVTSGTANELEKLVTFIVSQLPVWITGGIVIILSFVLARIVQSSVENRMAQSGFDEENKEIQVVVGRVTNIAVIIIGVTVGLKIAGIDLTAIIAAGAFGIGFALQDLIINFLAGVMILSARHYKIGDIIRVNSIFGRIVDIQTRATIVKNFDGTKVVVPNAELFKNPVTSLTSNPYRRVSVETGVEYGADLHKCVAACLKAATESKNALTEPKPSVWITSFGESSINLRTNVWVESSKGIVRTRTDLVARIKKELDAVNENIPFPIRTIVFDEDARKEQEEKRRQMEEEEKKFDQVMAQKPEEKPEEENPEKIETAKQSGLNPEAMNAPDWLKKTAQEITGPTPALQTAPVTVIQETAPAAGEPPEISQPPVAEPAPAPVPMPSSEPQAEAGTQSIAPPVQEQAAVDSQPTQQAAGSEVPAPVQEPEPALSIPSPGQPDPYTQAPPQDTAGQQAGAKSGPQG